jgi:FtsP/CotA-like multicopper oxidase with cupredoxin domain
MIRAFGKLRARVLKAYLRFRFRIREAQHDMAVIQADVITAPHRVAAIRAYVAELAARVESLEVR